MDLQILTTMRRLLFMAITLLATACLKAPLDDTDYRERLVVEGRIEEGRGAVVSLSLNGDYGGIYNGDQLRAMVVRWAKVTVISEGDSVVLSGRSNKDYPTQYIYTSSRIKGEVGKSYTLLVEYGGRSWSSTTTLPPRAELEDVRVKHLRDTLYEITATLPATASHCLVECSLEGSSYYAPTPLGIYEPYSKPRRITITRPLDKLNRLNYATTFHPSDDVRLRLVTMDDFCYDYWNVWQNNYMNSVNPIFPAVDNLPTNISNGALGIWMGCGASYHTIGTIAPEE